VSREIIVTFYDTVMTYDIYYIELWSSMANICDSWCSTFSIWGYNSFI